MTMIKTGRIVWLGGLIGATLALAGCRPEEQGRPLAHNPGVYQGSPDTSLTDEQRRLLQDRASLLR
ncbi:MAG: hypothetical protein NW217_05555 [Hyphomicrobiaceae bacterium]|nr:hypothetical protein [Hyphomicrobiaceae bacterium]